MPVCVRPGCAHLAEPGRLVCGIHLSRGGKCAYQQDCNNEALPDTNVCVQHVCQISRTCAGQKNRLTPYCTDHTCLDRDCWQPRSTTTDKRFVANTDPVEFQRQGFLYRNFCAAHACRVQWCQQPAVVPHGYCTPHKQEFDPGPPLGPGLGIEMELDSGSRPGARRSAPRRRGPRPGGYDSFEDDDSEDDDGPGDWAEEWGGWGINRVGSLPDWTRVAEVWDNDPEHALPW